MPKAVGVNQTSDVHKFDCEGVRDNDTDESFLLGFSGQRFCPYTEVSHPPRTEGAAWKNRRCTLPMQKASSKAKLYSGGIERSNGGFSSFRTLSYEKKSQALKALCSLLLVDSAGIEWGWGSDEENSRAPHVLYLDLPSGQVRFHSAERFAGPDYRGTLDGERASEARIISYCDQFAEGLVLPPERPREVREFDPYAECDTDQWED